MWDWSRIGLSASVAKYRNRLLGIVESVGLGTPAWCVEDYAQRLRAVLLGSSFAVVLFGLSAAAFVFVLAQPGLTNFRRRLRGL